MRRCPLWIVCTALCMMLWPTYAGAMLHPQQGQLMQRDPLRYVDGMSPCQSRGSNPVLSALAGTPFQQEHA